VALENGTAIDAAAAAGRHRESISMSELAKEWGRLSQNSWRGVENIQGGTGHGEEKKTYWWQKAVEPTSEVCYNDKLDADGSPVVPNECCT